MVYPLVFIFIVLLAVSQAGCPNHCSGHGLCGQTNVCQCFEGWNGGAPDCSFRQCPNGTAWADKPYAQDKAHQIMECSNAGMCDRNTGVCKCFAGYTGSACQRSTCPNQCSGHGVCSTIADLALWRGPDYDPYQFKFGDGFGPAYDNWDKDSIQVCECDGGYFGPDCSLVMCPKGDDPLTINQNFRRIRLRASARFGKTHSGTLGLQFQGTKVYIDLNSPSSAKCTEELSNRGKFGQVLCSYTRFNRGTFFFDLTFVNWPVTPKDNNLYNNDGNPSTYDFFCDVSLTNFAQCHFFDLVADNIREYATCSNRGTCNYKTGLCDCLDGFGGPACSNMTNLYFSGANGVPGMEVTVQPLNFTSSVLYLRSMKSAARDFDLITAYANHDEVFAVRGDGHVQVQTLFTPGGQTIGGSGLYISTGGMTVNNDPVVIYTEKEGIGSLLSVTSAYEGSQPDSFYAMTLTSRGINENNHYLLAGIARNNRVRFLLRADGAVFIRNGGLRVTGGTTINSGGIRVSDGGLTVATHGIQVTSGGLSVLGGSAMFANSLRVNAGGLQVLAGGVTIGSGGLRLQAGGMSVLSGGLVVTGGGSVNGGLRVTGGISVQDLGLFVTGGVSVANVGLVVRSGGLTVSLNGGSGLRVMNGGATIVNTGLVVTTGGITVTNGPIIVSNGGMTVQDAVQLNNDLTVAGTVSIENGLVVITGGITVSVDGVVITTGGMTISNDGLTVDGGMTVTGGVTMNNQLSVAGDAEFQSNLYVTGGLSVTGTGPTSSSIKGGLTVIDGGISVTAGGLTVDSGVITSSDGVVVTGGGLTVSAGSLLVSGTGVTVTSQFNANAGLTVSNGFSADNAQASTLVVANSLTVTAGGFIVEAAGVDITNDMTVTGSVTVSAGIVVSGGLSVTTGSVSIHVGGLSSAGAILGQSGLIVTGGASVANGLAVINGVSMAGGVTVAGGLTVGSGLLVTGGASISSALAVTGTITATDLMSANGGMSVSGNGLTVGGGVTVTGFGMSVTGNIVAKDGMTVGNSLHVTGGMSLVGGLTITGAGFTVANGATIGSGALVGGGLSATGGLTIVDDSTFTGDVTITGNLVVTGTITASGAPVTSDQRLKTDIEVITNALSKVKQLRGVFFQWNATAMAERNILPTEDEQRQRQVGVIAQEVQAVMPELVRVQSVKKPSNRFDASSPRSRNDTLSETRSLQEVSVTKNLSEQEQQQQQEEARDDTMTSTSTSTSRSSLNALVDEENEYLTVNYMSLAPLLIEAVRDLDTYRQDMQQTIHTLQQENQALKDSLAGLQKQIQDIMASLPPQT